MDSASLVWLAVCTVLVLVLLGGFAALQAGRARAKNAVHGLLQMTLGMGLVSAVFVCLGDSVAFGPTAGGWLGVSPADHGAAGSLGRLYQGLVAVIPLAIVCSAVAERVRTLALLAFGVVLAALIYPVFAHWTLSPQGWLAQLGLVDGAGAAAVQALGAWCALAALYIVGPRLGRFGPSGELRTLAGHSQPMVGLGVWLLWAGWFGLIGAQIGSLSADDAASRLGQLLLNTQLGAAAGLLAAMLMLRTRTGTVPLRGAVNGALCGLVSLCAGAAVLSPLGALVTGAIAGLLCTWAGPRLLTARLDDAADTVAVHGLGAVWGLLAAGLFYAGDAFNGQRVLVQGLAALASFAWGFPLAWGTLRLIDRLGGGLRADSRDEMRGLDYTEHRAVAYPERAESVSAIKLEG